MPYKNKEKEIEHRKSYYAKNKEYLSCRNKKYGITHKKEISENKKKYWEANRETLRIKNKEHYRKRRDERLTKQKIYAENTKDHKKEYDRKYRKLNKTKRSFWNNSRRVRKLNAGGFHSINDWEILKAQYNWTCPSCKKQEPIIFLTRDHIIPIVKGGSDNIENIQPLCKSCNSKKYTTEVKYDFSKM